MHPTCGLCVLRTSDVSKSLTTTACGAFFDAAAATASPAHPSINAAVSVLYHRSFFNAAYAGLGTPPDGPQVKSSDRTSVQLHYRPGGNAGGPTEVLVECHPGARAAWWTSGVWRTTMELGMASDRQRDAQDHRAWSAIVTDAVNAWEAGQIRPG